jgi:quercetin dioxygenase-like cupin family protein
MARPGDVVENPLFGARATFLETTEQTNGELLRVEVVLPPGFPISEHVHPAQEERHDVLSGTLSARVGGCERSYGEGERVVGPPGVPHAWCNPSDSEELRLISEHRPALHMEEMLEGSFNISRDLQVDKRGALKHLLRLAVLMDEVKDDFYLTQAPMQALLVLFASLAPVGRLLGYTPSSPEYSGQRGAGGSEERRGVPLKASQGVAMVLVLLMAAFFVLRRRARA